jgi:hypothetical protein
MQATAIQDMRQEQHAAVSLSAHLHHWQQHVWQQLGAGHSDSISRSPGT